MLVALWAAVWIAPPGTVQAQDIIRFENGYLTFTNANPTLYYRIEFKPAPDEAPTWDGTYRGLRNIHSSDPLITVPVGLRHRVVGSPEPYVGGTATPGNVLTGKTAYVQDEEMTGTMPACGTVDFFPQATAQPIPRGYHSGKGEVAGDTNLVEHHIRAGTTLFGVNGTLWQAAGKATPAEVRESRTFSNDEGPAVGTMPNRSGHVTAQSISRSGTTLRFRPLMGYYPGTAANSIQFSDPDFIASHIAHGVQLFGLPGNFPPAAVPVTGQTLSFSAGDDAWWHTNAVGVAWPQPRFTDHGDGTVSDHLTGLMWTQDADVPAGQSTWYAAMDFCSAMNSGAGTYGYTDWRLPNMRELHSLVDYGQHTPPLPAGHPFTNVNLIVYWSSSTHAVTTNSAWGQEMDMGAVFFLPKSGEFTVWPVRGGM